MYHDVSFEMWDLFVLGFFSFFDFTSIVQGVVVEISWLGRGCMLNEAVMLTLFLMCCWIVVPLLFYLIFMLSVVLFESPLSLCCLLVSGWMKKRAFAFRSW